MKRAGPRPRRAAPIEVRATRTQPLGMPPARFLRDYWQKRPLLVRGAFPHVHNAITPEDLAGLACEEIALARIVVRDPQREHWQLRNGPFGESDFAQLPRTHWTLLVQDVDKWDADVAVLLEEFAFIPSWRVDDVMISYATDGGGVGPHVDNYDVFLVQGRGRRHWRISVDPSAPMDFRPDTELKLLRQFTPTHAWTLEPGDALYLPPGVPHDGIADGACLTFSLGMRAPAQAEMLLDLAEFLAMPLTEEQRYVDPDLAPARDRHEIDAAALARVARAVPQFCDVDPVALRQWFGTFITRYRVAHEAAPLARALRPERLAQRLPGAVVMRHPWTRIAWARAAKGAELYVAGQRYACSRAFARLLAGSRELAGAQLLAGAGANGLVLLTELVNAGHLRLVQRR